MPLSISLNLEYSEILATELHRLFGAFAQNELAYLALTSKPEFVIRDKLAFRLHCVLNGLGRTVSREWKRSDLAVLREGVPEVIVELKAMYHFDAVGWDSKSHPVLELIQKDVLKAQGLARPETQIYSILLSTHPHAPIRRELGHAVKYLSGINGAYNRIGSAEELREKAIKCIDPWFCGVHSVSGSIRGGEAFGTVVDVDFWLVGPYPNPG